MKTIKKSSIKPFLDEKVAVYNRPDFIPNDPVSIPHQYLQKQDIEITGFVTAVFSWGQRKTIINKSKAFFSLMGNEPYKFVMEHTEEDLKPFAHFKHRTFNGTDALYFLHFFRWFYERHASLEEAFVVDASQDDMEQGLSRFFELFFCLPDHPKRTYKHIPTPMRKSACKRLNMYLRWMVRKDTAGVDFGLWDKISPAQLVCPLDVHVERVARALGLLKRKQADWQAAVELTKALKKWDAEDPVKYDFALFGLGVEQYEAMKN